MLRRSFFRMMMGAAPAAAAEASTDKFAEQYASTSSAVKGGKGRDKTSLTVSLDRSRPGALLELLGPFQKKGINIHHINNREIPIEMESKYLTMFIDVDAHVDDPAMKEVLGEIKANVPSMSVIGSWHIPWYPTEKKQLDLLDQRTLSAGADIHDDPANPHPGFHDEEYKARRKQIAENAYTYKTGQKIGTVDYTENEINTWKAVYAELTSLYPTHACHQYNFCFPLFVEAGVFNKDRPPQLQEVSDFLESITGYTVRPVAGLLPTRDFLNAMAFRTFFSTQYLRHHSRPLYTPEPDMIHEILGHVPLFADPDFANFSQSIGFASLGASDAVIEKLARCYWYSVEFGLCRQAGGVRAYGAGLLSSPGELKYCLTKEPKLRDWDPFVASEIDFPITTYQPMYFVAEDFVDAQRKIKKFIDSEERPFDLKYNPFTHKVLTFSRSAQSMMRESRLVDV